MRIAHVIARLNDGGPARVLLALAELLPEQEMTVLHGDCGPGEPDLAPALAQRLTLRRIPGLGRRIAPWDDARAFHHVRTALADLRPDLVHTHTAKAGALGRIASQTLGLRCLHTYHGHVLDGYFPGPVNAVLAAIERSCAGRHHHHALTGSQVAALRDDHGIGQADRWHALAVPVPAIAPAAPVLAPGAIPTVLFLGRLVPVKDGALWLEVLAEVARQRPVRGLVCGTGPEAAALRQRADALGLDVTFAGQVTPGAALAAADVLLMTSRNEGQPLAAVEAARAGVPVVAPPVGGLADLAATGLVAAAERTAPSLARAVVSVLGPERSERIAAGHAAVQAFAPAVLGPAWRDLYRRVAGVLILLLCLLPAAWTAEPAPVPAPGQGLALVAGAGADGGLHPGSLLTWTVAPATATALEIVDPQGTPLYRPVFAVAGGGLQVRHTLRQPGAHVWRLHAGSAILSAGTWNVTGPPASDPIRVNPANPRLLAGADGRTFLPIGPNLAWLDGDPVAGFTRAFATARANGCTHLRVWFASWCLPLGGFAQPVDLAAAERIDRVFAAARANGLRLTVVIDNHQDVLKGPPLDGLTPPARAARQLALPLLPAWRQRLAYVLARWGADDAVLAWEVMNEPDLLAMRGSDVLPWLTAAQAELARLDVDHRLHVVGWSGTDWPSVVAIPGVDLVQLHTYVHPEEPADSPLFRHGIDGVGLLLREADRMPETAHPWLFGESGFQGTADSNLGNDLDSEGMLLTQQLWAGFLAGGCGPAMNWWWDAHIGARQLWPRYGSFAKVVGLVDWSDGDLAPMPANPKGPLRVLGWRSATQALVWPHLRADTWYSHLVEGRPRPRTTVAMPVRLPGFQPGAYRVESRDPVTAEAQEEPATVRVGKDGWLELRLPPGIGERVWVVRPGGGQ